MPPCFPEESFECAVSQSNIKASVEKFTTSIKQAEIKRQDFDVHPPSWHVDSNDDGGLMLFRANKHLIAHNQPITNTDLIDRLYNSLASHFNSYIEDANSTDVDGHYTVEADAEKLFNYFILDDDVSEFVSVDEDDPNNEDFWDANISAADAYELFDIYAFTDLIRNNLIVYRDRESGEKIPSDAIL